MRQALALFASFIEVFPKVDTLAKKILEALVHSGTYCTMYDCNRDILLLYPSNSLTSTASQAYKHHTIIAKYFPPFEEPNVASLGQHQQPFTLIVHLICIHNGTRPHGAQPRLHAAAPASGPAVDLARIHGPVLDSHRAQQRLVPLLTIRVRQRVARLGIGYMSHRGAGVVPRQWQPALGLRNRRLSRRRDSVQPASSTDCATTNPRLFGLRLQRLRSLYSHERRQHKRRMGRRAKRRGSSVWRLRSTDRPTSCLPAALRRIESTLPQSLLSPEQGEVHQRDD